MPVGKSFTEFRFLIQALKEDNGTIHSTSNSAWCSSAIQTTGPERDRVAQLLDLPAQPHSGAHFHPGRGLACKGDSSHHGLCRAPAAWRRCTSLAPKYSSLILKGSPCSSESYIDIWRLAVTCYFLWLTEEKQLLLFSNEIQAHIIQSRIWI